MYCMGSLLHCLQRLWPAPFITGGRYFYSNLSSPWDTVVLTGIGEGYSLEEEGFEGNCEEKWWVEEGEAWMGGRVREDPWDRHGDDRSPVVRSSLTRCPDPGCDTSQYGTRARNGPNLPFAFYPPTSTTSSSRSSFLQNPFQNISICLNFPPPLHSAPVVSNIPVARRSNEPQLRFTFLSNLGPSSHH